MRVCRSESDDDFGDPVPQTEVEMKSGGAQVPGKRRAADNGKTVNHTYETLKCNVTPRCVRDNEEETESEEEEQQDQEAVVEEMKWKLAQWMKGCKLYQAGRVGCSSREKGCSGAAKISPILTSPR